MSHKCLYGTTILTIDKDIQFQSADAIKVATESLYCLGRQLQHSI